jgi:ABC-2 type transport system ATP-binding protein
MTSATVSPLIVSRLAKSYGSGRGVLDVSLNVRAGSVTGFIGANGAGKSTTLRCVVGLAQPDRGRIELFGQPVSFELRRRIGFLPEERGLAPRERARDAIAFHARLKGLGRGEAYLRADALLERIGLAGRTQTRIEELSKGNAQRVQILCAIAHDPELLILDEPFSGLDPIAQAEVQSLFAEYRSKGGAILFSTHSMASAERLCDEVVILADGRTVFSGPLSEAAECAGHGAYLTTDDAAALQAVVKEIGGQAEPFQSQFGEALRWKVILPAQVPHVVLLRALAEHQLSIHGFEPIKADLEGAFWSLAAKRAAA